MNLYKCSLSLDSNTKFDTKKWQPVNTSDTNSYDTIWTLEDVFELNSESNAVLDLDFIDESGQSHTLPIKKQNNGLFGIKMPKFGYEFGSSVLDVLKEQLSSCKQLLEFEPDSKCKCSRSMIIPIISTHSLCIARIRRDLADGRSSDACYRP